MTTADFEIATPHTDDVDQLAAVHIQGWREAYGDLLPSRFYDAATLEQRREMWSQLLAMEDVTDRVRVARSADQIVGFALRGRAESHVDHAPVRKDQLYAIYALGQWYGTGVGQTLLDACLGDRPAQLWVARDNARARRFDEKNGFAFDGAEQVDPDLDGLVEIRMVR